MLSLITTSDIIEVFLAAGHTTNALPCVSSYKDTISGKAGAPGRTCINSNGTTPVIVVGAPASGIFRNIDYLSVFNNDTVSHTVTIQYDLSGTNYIIWKGALAAGEKVEYAEGVGFVVIATSGAVKHSINQGNSPTSSTINLAVLGSDQTNNNATANTIQDVTGLSFPVVANTRYWFRFFIKYTAAATSTGSRWTINGPANNELIYRSEYSLTLTTRTFNDGVSAYDSPAASNASSAATGSNIAIVEGFIRPTADGTVIARFASEVLSSAIVAKAGSVVHWQAA